VRTDHVPAALERRVRERAAEQCEYCGLAQAGQEATFHVDHVQPRRDGGPTTLENLALACVSCSLRKGARTQSVDPTSGEPAPLFNPRRERWDDHFSINAAMILRGRTPTGRATIELLQMNQLLTVAIRREEAKRGRYGR
jgi:hypothetical protein